jgi:DNA polymerase/3'-5' exonuclease PolX
MELQAPEVYPRKVRFPRRLAIEVARELCKALQPFTDRLVVAGSLRREKLDVGDVELLYIPKLEQVQSFQQSDLLMPAPINFANVTDERIELLLTAKVLVKRANYLGFDIWGPKNKLARHVKTQIPVDLFSTTAVAWWSYLVCRTGSRESNVAIAQAAMDKRWRWSPYEGFWDQEGNMIRPTSEEQVFELVGLPYKEPKDR